MYQGLRSYNELECKAILFVMIEIVQELHRRRARNESRHNRADQHSTEGIVDEARWWGWKGGHRSSLAGKGNLYEGEIVKSLI